MSSSEVTEEILLQRAAYTLQSAFAIFREATWHNHILTIKPERRQLTIKEDPEKFLRFQGWFSQYPAEKTPKYKDKAAVLMTMAGDDVGHLRALIEQMLEGMNAKYNLSCCRERRD